MKTTLAILAAFGLTTSLSSAAITILSGGSGSFATGSPQVSLPHTVLTGFDASSASKIVVTISTEDGFGDSPPTGVSFDGDSFGSPAVSLTDDSSGIQQASIFYLDASDILGGAFGTGDLVIDGTGDDDFGASWLFLSGTADGVGATNSAQGQSVSLTTSQDGNLVVAAHANNGSSGTAQSPLTPLLDADVGSAGGGSGYATIDPAGTDDYEFTGSSSRPVTVAAEFMIPEPSTALLGGLGLLALLRRRRA